MKNLGIFLVFVFLIVSCKPPTGTGDAVRTQPNKVEDALDTPSKDDTDGDNVNPDASTATEYIVL